LDAPEGKRIPNAVSFLEPHAKKVPERLGPFYRRLQANETFEHFSV